MIIPACSAGAAPILRREHELRFVFKRFDVLVAFVLEEFDLRVFSMRSVNLKGGSRRHGTRRFFGAVLRPTFEFHQGPAARRSDREADLVFFGFGFGFDDPELAGQRLGRDVTPRFFRRRSARLRFVPFLQPMKLITMSEINLRVGVFAGQLGAHIALDFFTADGFELDRVHLWATCPSLRTSCPGPAPIRTCPFSSGSSDSAGVVGRICR